MTYTYYLQYSYDEWNDFPLVRIVEKFVHKLGSVLSLEIVTDLISSVLIRQFSSDK